VCDFNDSGLQSCRYSQQRGIPLLWLYVLRFIFDQGFCDRLAIDHGLGLGVVAPANHLAYARLAIVHLAYGHLATVHLACGRLATVLRAIGRHAKGDKEQDSDADNDGDGGADMDEDK
jgi:hypothetical protein